MKVISLPFIESQSPFIRYAVSVWGRLVRQHENNDTVFELALTQLREPAGLDVLRHGDVEIDRSILSFNYVFGSGASALHLAAGHNLIRTGEGLLTTQMTLINERDGRERTPLLLAAEFGHTQFARMLLYKPNIDLNARDAIGVTALYHAVEKRNLELVTALVEATPDLDTGPAEDGFRFTPISLAAQYGFTEIVKVLLSSPAVNRNDKDAMVGRTPLCWAASKGHREVVKMLLEDAAVDVNAGAGKHNHPPSSKEYQAPLALAVRGGRLDLVKLLLEHPDINVNDIAGLTALHVALTSYNLKIVEAMLNTPSIDIDARDEHGQTLLIRAVRTEYLGPEEVFLTNSNSDVNATSNHRETVLSYIPIAHMEELLFFLRIAFAKPTRLAQLSWAIENRHCEIVRLLLTDVDLDINATDEAGWIPLSLAVEKGFWDVVQVLLDHPAIDVNVRNKWYQTPLLQASAAGRLALVSVLLNAPNVDINAKDECGRTALSLASLHGHSNVVRLLLSHPNVIVDARDRGTIEQLCPLALQPFDPSLTLPVILNPNRRLFTRKPFLPIDSSYQSLYSF